MTLEGKVALVTGAARNIGLGYARALAREGASVVVSDILDTKEAVSAIEEGGGTAVGIHADVSDESSVEALFRASVETFGAVDVVVNNAALYGELDHGPLESLPLDLWNRTLAINLTGCFLCVREAFRVMRDRGGSIINISSGTVWAGSPGGVHYVSSKAGILGLTRTAAREGGPYGIRVNTITPGFILSEASMEMMRNRDGNTEDRAERVRAITPLGRNGQPEDLLGAVIYLAGDASAFVTGQTINVDGGWHMT